MFDFSSYLTKSKFYDNSNKLVVGKMKDEIAGVPIKEFVGLKSKVIVVNIKKQKVQTEILLKK